MPRPDLTLADAVAVLNREGHRGANNWRLLAPGADLSVVMENVPVVVASDDSYDRFSPFEAIAVAERYRRAATAMADGAAVLAAAARQAIHDCVRRPMGVEPDSATRALTIIDRILRDELGITPDGGPS